MQLYKISFTTTPKVYIGISSYSANARLKAHCHQKNDSLIARAIKKHGNPILTIIAECRDWELLCLAEQEAIEKYKSKCPNGYNLTDGGEGLNGYKHTDDQRKAQSERSINYFKNNPQAVEQQRIRMKEKFLDENFKKIHSEKQKERFNNEESRKQLGDRSKKFFESEESRINHGLIMKEYNKNNPERALNHGKRMKQMFLEKPYLGDNHSKKMKDFYIKNPEKKKEIGEKAKKYYEENPEARIKASEKTKEYYKNNPQAGKEHSDKLKKIFKENPELSKQNTKKIKDYYDNNENARKEASERNKLSKINYPETKIQKTRRILAANTSFCIKKGRPVSLLQKDYFKKYES